MMVVDAEESSAVAWLPLFEPMVFLVSSCERRRSLLSNRDPWFETLLVHDGRLDHRRRCSRRSSSASSNPMSRRRAAFEPTGGSEPLLRRVFISPKEAWTCL